VYTGVFVLIVAVTLTNISGARKQRAADEAARAKAAEKELAAASERILSEYSAEDENGHTTLSVTDMGEESDKVPRKAVGAGAVGVQDVEVDMNELLKELQALPGYRVQRQVATASFGRLYLSIYLSIHIYNIYIYIL
jgi:hypothetical protein